MFTVNSCCQQRIEHVIPPERIVPPCEFSQFATPPEHTQCLCRALLCFSVCVCVCLCQYMLPGYSRANNRHILGFLGNTVATFCCEWGCYFQENQKEWKTCIQRTVEFTFVLGGFFRHICSGVIITEASVHGGIITRGENAETQLEASKATCIHRFHDMPLQNESQET